MAPRSDSPPSALSRLQRSQSPYYDSRGKPGKQSVAIHTSLIQHPSHTHSSVTGAGSLCSHHKNKRQDADANANANISPVRSTSHPPPRPYLSLQRHHHHPAPAVYSFFSAAATKRFRAKEPLMLHSRLPPNTGTSSRPLLPFLLIVLGFSAGSAFLGRRFVLQRCLNLPS